MANRSQVTAMFFNPFASEEYTLVELCLYAADAIPRLETEFPDAADAVEAAVQGAARESGAVQRALGEQAARTSRLDAFLERVPGVVKGLEDKVSAALGGRDSEGFRALFPAGRTEFHNLTKGEAPGVMQRISQSVDVYGGMLDAETKAVLQGIEADWVRLRGSQKAKMAEVGTGRAERATAREALEDALWMASRTVLDRYPRDPERCLTFFKEHLLREARKVTEEGEASAAVS